MKRRAFLAGGGAAGLALLAGCSSGSTGGDGPRAPERRRGDRPRIDDFGTGAADDGRLLVWVVVTNGGSERRTATVTVTARTAKESETRSAEMTLDAGATERRELAFDLDADAFNRSGSLDFDLA